MIIHSCYPGLSGATDVTIKIASFFQKFKKNTIIFYGNKDLRKEYKVLVKKKKINFKIIKYNFTLFGYLKFFLNLIKLKPKKIFLNNFNIIPTILYKFFYFQKLDIYVIWHTDLSQNKNLIYNIIFILQKIFCKKIIFVNSISIKNKKYKVIYNGIDTNFFKRKKIKKNKTIFFGMASRLEYQKRYDLILNAIHILKNKIKNKKFCFLIAGSGSDLKKIKKLILTNKLTKEVLLLGDLTANQLVNFYNKINVYVHISDFEFKSISILQAMSFKLPIIASNIKNNQFIKTADKKNFLIRNDSKIIANTMYLALNKNSLVKNNRKYVKKNCNALQMQKNYLKLIK